MNEHATESSAVTGSGSVLVTREALQRWIAGLTPARHMGAA